MANIRIAQQLSTGYNPDGTPGTVTTGVPGMVGPGPTDDQVMMAVTAYITAHPLSGMAMGIDTAPLTKHGAGAGGSAGAWVGLGDNGSTVTGYVVAGGSMPNVDLRIQPKGTGKIYLDGPVGSDLIVLGNLTLDQNTNLIFGDTGRGGSISVGQLLVQNQMVEDMPDSVIQNLRAGSSYFSGRSFSIAGYYTTISDLADQSNWNTSPGIKVWSPPNGGAYAAVTASKFTVASDRRFKTDIVELTGALEEVRTTPAYSYRMNDERRRGLIADEAPTDVVRTDDRGYQLIESYDLVGTLWAAVRELADKLEGMEQTCRCQPTR